MINVKKFCALLVILGLVACDDQATTSTANTQSAPAFDSFQSFNGIDQLKATLLENPNDSDTLAALGDMYFESSQFFEAILTYDQAIAMERRTCTSLAVATCPRRQGRPLLSTDST